MSICSTALKVLRSSICCISSRVAHWKSFSGSCFRRILEITKQIWTKFKFCFHYLNCDTSLLINLVLNVSLTTEIMSSKMKEASQHWTDFTDWTD